MADINSVVLSGRLVRPGEIRYSQGGTSVVRFSIAVNRVKRSADGKWDEEPNYFDCVYFGKAAEAVNQYLDKGRQVTVQGELRQSRWESEGQTRNRVEIAVSNLSLGSPAGANSGSQARSNNYQSNNSPRESYNRPQMQSAPVSAPINEGPEDFTDDTIPF